MHEQMAEYEEAKRTESLSSERVRQCCCLHGVIVHAEIRCVVSSCDNFSIFLMPSKVKQNNMLVV